MTITVERIEAEVRADPTKAIRDLERFERKIKDVANTQAGRTRIGVDTSGAERDLLRLQSLLDSTGGSKRGLFNMGDSTRDTAVLMGLVTALGTALGNLGNESSSAGAAMGVFKGSVTQASAVMQGVVGQAQAFASQMNSARAQIQGVATAAGGAGAKVTEMGNSFAGAGGKGANLLSALAGPALTLGSMAAILPWVFSGMNALAGSAVALAGALAPLSGLLVAIPAGFLAMGAGIGTLISGFGGVSDALAAYEQQENALNRATQRGAMDALERRAAERGLEEAVRGVTRAQKELEKAEKAVAQARVDAAKDIKNARMDMDDAVLNEQDAVDRLTEAQENLARAQNRVGKSSMTITKAVDEFTGKVYEVASTTADAADENDTLRDAQRAVERAQRDLLRAQDATAESRERLNELESKGVEGSDKVQDSLMRLVDAQDALARSRDGVVAAQERISRVMEEQRIRAEGGTAASAALAKAMAALTPAGRSFVQFIRTKLKPAYEEIQKTSQEGLLPGIEQGLRNLLPAAGMVQKAVGNIATTMGEVFRNWTTQVMEAGRQTQMRDVLESTNIVIDKMGRGFGELSLAMLNIVDTARPFTEWLATEFHETMTDFREKTDEWAANGKLTEFFQKTKDVLIIVKDIVGNVAGTLWNLASAGAPSGNSLLESIRQTTQGWQDATGDPANRAKITRWFDGAIRSARDMFRLLGDILGQIATIGQDGTGQVNGFGDALRSVGDALPGIKTFMQDASGIVDGLASGLEKIADLYLKVRYIENKTDLSNYDWKGTYTGPKVYWSYEDYAKDEQRKRDIGDFGGWANTAAKPDAPNTWGGVEAKNDGFKDAKDYVNGYSSGIESGMGDAGKKGQEAFKGAFNPAPVGLERGNQTAQQYATAIGPGMDSAGVTATERFGAAFQPAPGAAERGAEVVQQYDSPIGPGMEQTGRAGASRFNTVLAADLQGSAPKNATGFIELFQSTAVPGAETTGDTVARRMGMRIDNYDFTPQGRNTNEEIARGMEDSYPRVEAAGGGLIELVKTAWSGLGDWLRDVDWNPFGDGPGAGWGSNGAGGWGTTPDVIRSADGSAGKGSAGQMASSAISRFGGRITSSYRTPAQNAAAGGSRSSYHLDKENPAHDIVGPNMEGMYNWLAGSYGPNIREMIYGNRMWRRGQEYPYNRNDHWDHLHIAHAGGQVSRTWPTLPGLRQDERPAILQVGERVVPTHLNNGGDGLSQADLERILEKVLAHAKPNVQMQVDQHEHSDPRLLSAELAWALR